MEGVGTGSVQWCKEGGGGSVNVLILVYPHVLLYKSGWYRREESLVSRINQSINSSIKGDQMLHKKWGDGAPICQFRIYCTHIRSSEQVNNICKIIIPGSMV